MTPSQDLIEKLAEQLHEWYLEACQRPESGFDFNPKAQEPYEGLSEEQKFLDRYIAGKIFERFLSIQEARDKEWEYRLIYETEFPAEVKKLLDEIKKRLSH